MKPRSELRYTNLCLNRLNLVPFGSGSLIVLGGAKVAPELHRPQRLLSKKLFKKVGSALSKAWKAIVWKPIKKQLQAISRVKWLSSAISIGLSIMCGPQCSMLFNAAMTMANGGTIGQMLTGVAIALIPIPDFGGAIASVLPLGELAGQAVGATLQGGILSVAQGGKFVDGAKGGLIGFGIAKGISWANNKMASWAKGKQGGVQPEGNGKRRSYVQDQEKIDAIDADLSKIRSSAKSLRGTEDDIVKWLNEELGSMTDEHGVEFGATIAKYGDDFGVSSIVTDYCNTCVTITDAGYASFHTHPGNRSFSGADIVNSVARREVVSYVGLSNGQIHRFDTQGFIGALGAIGQKPWSDTRRFLTPTQAEVAGEFNHIY